MFKMYVITRFLSFGGAVPQRPVEDLAFAVACFFIVKIISCDCFASGKSFIYFPSVPI